MKFLIPALSFFLFLLQVAAEPSYFVAEEPEDDNILRTRTYDVSIT